MSISICCLSIKGSYTLSTCRLIVVQSIAHWSLALLILYFDQSPIFLYKKVAYFSVSISGCKVKGSISKFILVINLDILLRANQIDNLKVAWFNGSKQGSFIKFILNCGSDASLHKIITCPGLTSFSSVVKQTVSECVLECYWICPRAFIKFNNVYEPMLGTYKH